MTNYGGPIILSEKDAEFLEKLMKKNEKRTKLTKWEKELLEGSKEFDDQVTNLLSS